MEKALFAAGCFWGVEAEFQAIEGVVDTRVGYSGGHTQNPTYEDVCSGETGYAETVEVTYDPAVISYRELVKAFFKMHDPTQENGQGPDSGEQYRSAIFFFTPEQEKRAHEVTEEISSDYKKDIQTEITPAGPFYEAEEYHQDYLKKKRRT
ncbi:peptide-methionine (S)-S-oxide reductase [Candidatus Kaiserbacteria bacterium CG10_big_fil_rev_8_21_14_0_10_49_17]|uniref:Peptide methionine sulfoxide reductase MsrA n=1 Tax=Candidatus Kaiserbacteria bacterium CG10_big_fil_rev_8_21_14_0_10_49_17 TaxID=1974609 RepID=A0A2M6WEP2_9BACT|nr:MAG: peptide-methionine (S)-S-oxide reductase [Candidatus Kaiserbacteria bacterium CG10_big_fil_rev_8_21_14_0_10_49_17]